MKDLKQFIKTTIREFLNESKLDDYSLSTQIYLGFLIFIYTKK
jgi:hypothetical protein